MITLKHICREFDLEPYPLRQKLRQKLTHRKNQRWKWLPEDPQLTEVRNIAREMRDATSRPK